MLETPTVRKCGCDMGSSTPRPGADYGAGKRRSREETFLESMERISSEKTAAGSKYTLEQRIPQ
jgi:hypothetical protein